MTRQNASTFPNHKYDFGDRVFVPRIGRAGTIEGIWHRSNEDTWQYRLSDLPHLFDAWWLEEQLEPACPRCFAPWDEKTHCKCCGLSPDDLS
ncbi:MAG: hypothetical protein HC833_10810 [Leptolyngbyaceae cyanobacterium RM1_406_9]|nr:hypothetical protein [Leptolyngbyaceae cyanobacterium RM1_406_9]